MSWKLLGQHFSKYHKHFVRATKISKICPVGTSNIFLFRNHVTDNPVDKSSSPAITNVEKKFQKNIFNETGETADQSDEKASAIRSMKYTFLFLGISLTAVGSYVIMVYGRPLENEEGIVLLDEFSDLPIWKQYILRGIKQIENFATFIKEPSRDKLLPDTLAYPYYQPPYTLVLEFTDVLAHPEWTYETGWRFRKRPGVNYLLENLAGLYEIVVFTAEPGITIFPVIEALDQKGLISYKLVRDSTHFVEGHHVKNLEKLNRDLSKVIVIDWDKQSVKFHPDNHFVINRWMGNEDDTLVELTAFLRTIAETDIEDVREVVRFYKQYENPLAVFKQKQCEYLESQNKVPEKPVVQPRESMKRLFNILV